MKICVGAVIVLFLILTPVSGETYSVNQVTAFVSPDSSMDSLEGLIDSAHSSIYINVYTFENPYIMSQLLEARDRGVDILILVDGSPVGGIKEDEKAILEMLKAKGVGVYYDSNNNYRYNHAKYIVADNITTLISTENFNYGGYPPVSSKGNRGWGVIILDAQVSRYFLDLYFNDISFAKKREYPRENMEFSLKEGGYKKTFSTETYNKKSLVTPVIAPENARDEIIGLIVSAQEKILVEQFYIYKFWGGKYGSTRSSPNEFLEACLDAARRGVEVKILMDSTWYNVQGDDPKSNLHTVRYVNDIAHKEGIDLEARLLDEGLEVEKIHAKGLIVDDRVFISSINWNEHSPTNNREVGVIIQGEVSDYFEDVFYHDWEGGGRREAGVEVQIILGLVFLSGVYLASKKIRV